MKEPCFSNDSAGRAVDDGTVVAEVVHAAVLNDGSGILKDCHYGGYEYHEESFHAGVGFTVSGCKLMLFYGKCKNFRNKSYRDAV